MSEYVRKTLGPGDIAALPPTIGLTSRMPTIGAEDIGVPIHPAFPMHPASPWRRRRGWPVQRASALMGVMEDHPWVKPVGIGAAIGVGLAFLMRNR